MTVAVVPFDARRPMHVVCPECACQNPVVPDYKVGSIFACACGAFLEFTGPDQPPNVVPEDSRLWSSASLQAGKARQ